MYQYNKINMGNAFFWKGRKGSLQVWDRQSARHTWLEGAEALAWKGGRWGV